jgi:uncharacterized iron-regulated protein
LGNAQLDKAQVICFGEHHFDWNFHAYEVSVIRRLYQPGDVVLMEGLESGNAIGNLERTQLRDYMRCRVAALDGFTVHGRKPKKHLDSKKPSVEARNRSLIAQIKRFRNEGKKVFVIAGAEHVVELPTKDQDQIAVQKRIKEVRNFLEKSGAMTFFSKNYLRVESISL